MSVTEFQILPAEALVVYGDEAMKGYNTPSGSRLGIGRRRVLPAILNSKVGSGLNRVCWRNSLQNFAGELDFDCLLGMAHSSGKKIAPKWALSCFKFGIAEFLDATWHAW